MSLTISEQTEARLTEEARRHAISVDTLLQRLVSEHASGVSARRSNIPELPVWPVAVIGSLHGRDVYDDVP